jgi:hypothetical protein
MSLGFLFKMAIPDTHTDMVMSRAMPEASCANIPEVISARTPTTLCSDCS